MSTNSLSGADVRAQARSGLLTGPTCGLAPDYLQANIVILPERLAGDFLRFCEWNPKPCPLLEVTDPGSWEPRNTAPGSDIRTDIPKYAVYRHGVLVEELTDIAHLWRSDLVTFLLGCSFSFESAMQRAGLPVRHIEERCNVPMYRTNMPCTPAGPFAGPLVVTMRPLTPRQAIEAILITSRYPNAHGTPVHFGDSTAIGISDLDRPDFGDRVTVREGEVPVFWACGVTTQVVLTQAKLEIVITHSPGCMFVTDQLA
ncbi:MAG: putative hydro-lyase [Acidobacteria bacterium]|nr:putative hydro-lyase [Acidobacteriota bacterium]